MDSVESQGARATSVLEMTRDGFFGHRKSAPWKVKLDTLPTWFRRFGQTYWLTHAATPGTREQSPDVGTLEAAQGAW